MESSGTTPSSCCSAPDDVTTEYEVDIVSLTDTAIDTPNGRPAKGPPKGKGKSAGRRLFRDKNGKISRTPARPNPNRKPKLLKLMSAWERASARSRGRKTKPSSAQKSARRVSWGVCETTLVPSAELGTKAVASASGRFRKGKGRKAGQPVDSESPTAEHSLPDCWIADTGCGHDLLASKWVSECDKNKVRATDTPLTFAGVGGEKPADMTLRVKSPALRAHAEPFVLDSTPDVLSIGRRCVEDGWSFYWPPYSLTPIFTSPGGLAIKCRSHGFIPYVIEREEPCAAARPVSVNPNGTIEGHEE